MEKSNIVQVQKKLWDYDQKSIDLIYKLQDFTDCQLLSITHEIYKSFDYSPMRNINGIFLNISNVFVKIWHEGLIFKLQSYGIERSFEDY